MLDFISTFKNLPRLDLWPRVGSIYPFSVENVPCSLQQKVKSLVFRWNAYRYQLGLTGPVYHLFFYLFFNFLKFYFIFKLYNIVLVLPNIEMNLPQVYLCSPSWTLLPPPSPYPPSGSSQCTSPKHPVSCIKPGLATPFIHDIIHVSMLFSQISPPSPSPTESIRLIYSSMSLLLSRTQGYCYHLSKFHMYMLVYCIGVFLSGLLHSV